MQKDNQKVVFDPFLGFVFLHTLHLSLVHGNPSQVLISSSLFVKKMCWPQNGHLGPKRGQNEVLGHFLHQQARTYEDLRGITMN